MAEVDSTSLHEDQLVDLIAKAEQTIIRYRKLWNLEYDSDQPNNSLLNSLDRQIDIQQELKRKLQEKLDKLRFHASSPKIFSAIDSLAQAVNQGMRQAKMSWNSGTQTFDIPSRGDLAWTKAINQQWLDRKVSKTSFRDQIDSLTLAELEKQYGDVIQSSADTVYIGSGYDGRYAGLKVSPEEADYIRSRYALLKAQGQMSLKEKEQLDFMFEHLTDSDKKQIDSLNLKALVSEHGYLGLVQQEYNIKHLSSDKASKARLLYTYYHYEKLMAKEPIDWRDPQFMEKLNAHINETGLNPFTGQPATEGEKLVAKHYGWVKSSSTIATSVIGALIDFKTGGWKYAGSQNISSIKSSYSDFYDYEFNSFSNPGPLLELPGHPNKNFFGGRYNIEIIEADVTLYRAGRNGVPLGKWFTIRPPHSRAEVRINTAVKPMWISPSGVFEAQSPLDMIYAVKIPKGTVIYRGPVGSQGGIYQGGLEYEQIFIDTPWKIEGLEIVDTMPIK